MGVSPSSNRPAVGKSEHIFQSLLQFVGTGYFIVKFFLFSPLQEVIPDLVAAERVAVAHDDHEVLGAGEGDVDAALVSEKAQASAGVRPDGGDDDDVLLLPLERVDRVDHHVLLEVRQVLRPPPQLVPRLARNHRPLRLVGRDDAHADIGRREAFHQHPHRPRLRLVVAGIAPRLLPAVLDVDESHTAPVEALQKGRNGPLCH